jgi:hypothetical protein
MEMSILDLRNHVWDREPKFSLFVEMSIWDLGNHFKMLVRWAEQGYNTH